MDGSLLVAVLALIAGILGTILGWLAGNRQYRVAAITAAWAVLEQIRSWAFRVIDALSEAKYLSDAGGTPDQATRLRLRRTLSALVEEGRLLFPNVDPEKHGSEKLPAYRGYRHAVLDPVMAAERVLGGKLGTHRTEGEALYYLRQVFVSRVQAIVDPRRHNQELAKLIQTAATSKGSDKTLGGLVSNGSVPSGADALLHSQVGPEKET